MHTPDLAVVAEGLVKRFGDTVALDGADLSARTGSVLAILGPNGAGKTTAVRILATLSAPDAGSARVGGFDVVREAHRVRQIIALTGQSASVDPNLTGTENLVLLGRLLGLSRPEARSRAAQLLAQFELSDAAARATSGFSGGMRRRLDLASSLVGRPQILFLDEPTTGLDPRSRNDLWAIVRRLVGDGVTVLLTTQYLEEADQLADDIAVVDRGRVVATGTPTQLKSQTGSAVLHVTPARRDDLDEAERILAVVADGARREGVDAVQATVRDAGTMPLAVARLAEAGIEISEINLRQSTLDEVFLALTGGPAVERTGDEQSAPIDPPRPPADHDLESTVSRA